MDRVPLPPPFPAGTRLRYIGSRRETSGRHILIAPGVEVIIARVVLGRRGTGEQIDLDEDLEPIYDRTVDGHSIYEVQVENNRKRGVIIRPAAKAEWHIVGLKPFDVRPPRSHTQQIRDEKRWRQITPLIEPNDRTLIAGALRVAAQQYQRDADAALETPQGYSVGEQFTFQAMRAEWLAELIEL